MNRVLIPVIGTAVVYIIAQGWLTTLWQNLYNTAHGGSTGAPSPQVLPGTQGLYPSPPGSWNAQHPGQPIPGPLGGAQVHP